LGLNPALSDGELERIVEFAGISLLRMEIASALGELSEDHRDVLRLRIIEELSYPDVARRLDISEQTARARVSRALRALSIALVHEGEHA
jgi:RNA polymerase sigma factor (sigma-70 family)